MKKVVIIFILLTASFMLYSQQSEIIEAVREESESLQELEQEISYYHGLIERRKEISKLYRENNIKSIKKIFNKDLKAIDRDFYKSNFNDASIKIAGLKVIYDKIPFVKDQILYYKAKLANFQENYPKAKILLEEIVENYPNSEIIDSVIEELGDNYFYSGEDAKFVALFDNYSKEKSFDLIYKLGQANYNLGKLNESKSYFAQSLEKKNLANRSKMMLALIDYQEFGAEHALDSFLALRGEINPNKPYYDFVILTIARLYTEIGDLQRALAHYDLYVDMKQGNLDDEILFELGNVNLNAMNFDEAILYFGYLTTNFPRSKYYISARYQLALAEQGRDGFDDVEDKFAEIIAQNTLITKALNKKYTLLEKYKNKVSALYSGDYPQDVRVKLKKEIALIDTSLQKTNNIIRNLYSALDEDSLSLLQILEEEYKNYVYTLENVNSIMMLAENNPNTKLTSKIDRLIEEDEQTKKILELIRLLGHRDSFTDEDYQIAKNIVDERLYEKKMLKSWQEIMQQAKVKNMPLIERRASISMQLTLDNLKSLDIVANLTFQGTPSDVMKAMIDDELNALNKNREEMQTLRTDVIENFNKKIVKKLDTKKVQMNKEFADIKELYNKVYKQLQEQILDYQQNYEITYLDLLFKQTQIADEEYNKMQEKASNE